MCVNLAAQPPRPPLKSLQRPVSWTAHFNASVSGLREGWPLYEAHTVTHPANPTHPTTQLSARPRVLTRSFMLTLPFFLIALWYFKGTFSLDYCRTFIFGALSTTHFKTETSNLRQNY